jgi:hypothetical protein
MLIDSPIGRAPVAASKTNYHSYPSSTCEAPDEPGREEEEHRLPTRMTLAAQKKAKYEDMIELLGSEDLSVADISSSVHLASKNGAPEGGNGPLATIVCSAKDEPRGFVYHHPPRVSHAFL